jgi:hypothetical protein
MGSYPVPGEWFDSVSVPGLDDSDYDGYYVDELDVFDDEDFDPRPGRVRERGELEEERAEPLSAAVARLRWLAGELARDRHRFAHVAQEVANSLVDVRAPAPRLPNGFEPSPTGNCSRCGRALPLPSMKGRPRKMCTVCSPPRR